MPSTAARIVVPLALFTLFPLSLHAQTFGNLGERAQGMGGAFVAVADDASAMYWNPAGLGWPTGAVFDAQLQVADDATFVGASLPVVGLTFYRLSTVYGSADRQNEGSGKVQVRTVTTSNAGATINQTVVNGLVIGSTFRLVRGGIEGFSAHTAFDLDVGAMFSARDLVRIGVTARNLRRPVFTSDLGQIAAARQVRMGVALVPRSLPKGVHGPFSVAVDADLTRSAGPLGDRREVAVGGEYWIAQGRLGVRSGARWNVLDRQDMAISGGLTAQLPHAAFIEGHVTKVDKQDDVLWGVGARFTF